MGLNPNFCTVAWLLSPRLSSLDLPCSSFGYFLPLFWECYFPKMFPSFPSMYLPDSSLVASRLQNLLDQAGKIQSAGAHVSTLSPRFNPWHHMLPWASNGRCAHSSPWAPPGIAPPKPEQTPNCKRFLPFSSSHCLHSSSFRATCSGLNPLPSCKCFLYPPYFWN